MKKWKLVPIEPTEGMLASVRNNPHPTRPDGWDSNHIKIYRAMLAAAPTPPEHSARVGNNLTALAEHDKEVRAKALEDAALAFDSMDFVRCTGNQIVITGYAEDELRRMGQEIREVK